MYFDSPRICLMFFLYEKPRFLYCKITLLFSLFPCCSLWKEVTMLSLHLSGELCSLPWWWNIQISIWNYAAWENDLFSLIYLCNTYLYLYGPWDICFMFWVIAQILGSWYFQLYIVSFICSNTMVFQRHFRGSKLRFLS